jgi:hypothetical protein
VRGTYVYSLLKFRALLNKVTCVYIRLNLDFKCPLMVIIYNSGPIKLYSVESVTKDGNHQMLQLKLLNLSNSDTTSTVSYVGI